MTMIACLAYDRTPVLIADSLISSRDGRANFTLPTVGQEHRKVTSLTGYKPHGTTEKLVVLSPNAMVAWAGDCEKAKTLIVGLKKFFGDGLYSEKYVMAYLDAEYPRIIPDGSVSFMFLIQEGILTKYRHYNCWQKEFPELGMVSIAGTGRDDFLDSLSQIIPAVSQIDDAGQRVVGAALGAVASLLTTEVFTGDPIAKGFGGSYEIGGIFGGVVTKFTDYCCVFWEAKSDANGLGIGPRKIIRGFLQNGNVCNYTADLVNQGSPELTKEEVFLTVPLLNEGPVVGKFETPDLNAQFQVNSFFTRGTDSKVKLGIFLEYRHDRKRHLIEFNSQGNKLEMKMDNERLGAAVKGLLPSGT
jgi:hypothetical protein